MAIQANKRQKIRLGNVMEAEEGEGAQIKAYLDSLGKGSMWLTVLPRKGGIEASAAQDYCADVIFTDCNWEAGLSSLHLASQVPA